MKLDNIKTEQIYNILKNLAEKSDEKRGSAVKDIELTIRDADNLSFQQIQKFIQYLKQHYIRTNDNSKKKIALQIIKVMVLGFSCNTRILTKFINPLVDIVIEHLTQNEGKLRLIALRYLHEICQKLEGKMLVIFHKVFENIIGKNTEQQDEETKKEVDLIDANLQNVLRQAYQNTSNTTIKNDNNFDIDRLMVIIKSKFKSTNPFVRLFLIKWINILQKLVPVEYLRFLPDVFEELVLTVGQQEKLEKLMQQAEKCINNFFNQLKSRFDKGNLEEILNINLINQILSISIKVIKGKSQQNSKKYALLFIKLYTTFFKHQLEPRKEYLGCNKNYFKKIIIERFDQVLQPILLLMSSQEEQIKKQSQEINKILIKSIEMINKQQQINFYKVIPLLKTMLTQKKLTSSSENVLQWIKFMLQNYNDKILLQINDIIEKLVQKLCQFSSSRNVIKIIENTKITKQYYEKLIQKMLIYIKNKINGNYEKINMNNNSYDKIQIILKKFSSMLEADQFCKTVSLVLVQSFSQNHLFIFQIVQHLTQLIITQKTMSKVRRKLQNNQDQQFFLTLFTAFKYNPSAVTCLCFLSQHYQLAYQIVSTLGSQIEITQNILVGYCKIIAMIEFPGLLCNVLRLAMLNYKQNRYLTEAMYGILMILPQGTIFDLLKNRLEIGKIPIDKELFKRQKMERGMGSNQSMRVEGEGENEGGLIMNQNLFLEYLGCQLKFGCTSNR